MNQNIPNTGTTIFTVMSALANEHHAINLSQGFPDFSIDAAFAELMDRAVCDGFNQYAPMPGLLDLRIAIANKIAHFQNVNIDPDTEITVTPGATYAIYTAFTTLLNKGDEVIVLEPAYDSYIPNIQLSGGIPIPVPLNNETFEVDWNAVANAVTPRTKAIIINNPHNPSGSTWKASDFAVLEKLVRTHNLYIIADEVYEHLVYDGKKHISVLQFPELRSRSFAVYSFGKVFHNTGWKIGYCVAPPELTQQFRMVHQFLAFSVNTPAQQALAGYLTDLNNITKASQLLQEKRSLFLELIAETKFRCLQPSQGSYFQLIDYSAISELPDKDFAIRLTKEYKVATIPLSPFYSRPNKQKLLRVCFAKKDETLKNAIISLKKV